LARSSSVKRTAQGKARAKAVIDFIEMLIVPSGHGAGKRFKLEPWQKAFIRDIYEPHRDGKRVVRRAILSVARRNGKTALIAAIALAHLVGPESIMNGEIYSAANDREQASIVYKFAKQIVELDWELLDKVEIIPSTKTMIARHSGSLYRAISAEAGTKHGLSPSVCIFDELAQARNRDLYDVLDSSFGSRAEPLFIIISTQSNDAEHTLTRLIDDGVSSTDPSIVCHLHAADEGCDLDDEAQWKKANPALGSFRDYEDLAAQIRKAKRLPSEEPKVRNLLLN
jgi:phage terminase large subunit-like protein